MAEVKHTPILVGVADVKNRSVKIEDALEPKDLMLQAIALALQDANLPASSAQKLQSSIDSINVVANWTWPYLDLPDLLAKQLGVNPGHKFESHHGGNAPVQLLDEASRRIALGQSKVAIVTGAEALASWNTFKAKKVWPPPEWTKLEDTRGVMEREIPNADYFFSVKSDLGTAHDLGKATQVYAVYENGFRAHRGQSARENHIESAKLYGEFAKAAEKHPYSWNYGSPAHTEESIGTVTKKNRMINYPYPLLMNAFNMVNLAAACVVTSTEFARELGIPEDRWIYPLGGAGTSDSDNFWDRPNYFSSPAISKSLDAALRVSGLTVGDIDLFDFYSCFPIVPKLAAHHLGLPITGGQKPTTLLGGLTSFGGAGNNYSMHAVTEMVRQIRAGRGQKGLVLANGGLLTYQHVVCLSSKPLGQKSYPKERPLPEALQTPAPGVEHPATGEAVIETYTVDFNRDGSPSLGHIIGRLKSNGRRFIANAKDAATLQQLCSETKEPIGKSGWVTHNAEGAINIFKIDSSGRL
ncbi:hypothetical protein AJ80_02295 [Polytolypa hystricis UAMH7299]|uniref:Thiolase-like protein type 1 additional C-terminal domain-containing protein n=1 Tax=Polytolypa hystricis (strain UAMH7299) TaxID=1447883 RepID=A0A2B7YRL8_POLH7|nr:hypothetical protein AJ80_02295 [Polytolypa hystricis UAMH7299]